jgi:hypothetical protein
MIEQDEQTFRIYKVQGVKEKGLTVARWEVVSRLKVGEAVQLPIESRSKMINLASKHGISIRTLRIAGNPDKIEIIRVKNRPKKKGC